MNINQLWQSVLGDMQATVPAPHFAVWFKNTKLISVQESLATVQVPNGFVKEWLEHKFAKQILASAQKFEESIKELRIVV